MSTYSPCLVPLILTKKTPLVFEDMGLLLKPSEVVDSDKICRTCLCKIKLAESDLLIFPWYQGYRERVLVISENYNLWKEIKLLYLLKLLLMWLNKIPSSWNVFALLLLEDSQYPSRNNSLLIETSLSSSIKFSKLIPSSVLISLKNFFYDNSKRLISSINFYSPCFLVGTNSSDH